MLTKGTKTFYALANQNLKIHGPEKGTPRTFCPLCPVRHASSRYRKPLYSPRRVMDNSMSYWLNYYYFAVLK